MLGETDVELLKRMEPLQGKVEWSTWGSKLETIFEPVFSQIPTLAVNPLCVLNKLLIC
jgi:hypothetical protein